VEPRSARHRLRGPDGGSARPPRSRVKGCFAWPCAGRLHGWRGPARPPGFLSWSAAVFMCQPACRSTSVTGSRSIAVAATAIDLELSQPVGSAASRQDCPASFSTPWAAQSGKGSRRSTTLLNAQPVRRSATALTAPTRDLRVAVADPSGPSRSARHSSRGRIRVHTSEPQRIGGFAGIPGQRDHGAAWRLKPTGWAASSPGRVGPVVAGQSGCGTTCSPPAALAVPQDHGRSVSRGSRKRCWSTCRPGWLTR
jgi:hypothetical protein